VSLLYIAAMSDMADRLMRSTKTNCVKPALATSFKLDRPPKIAVLGSADPLLPFHIYLSSHAVL